MNDEDYARIAEVCLKHLRRAADCVGLAHVDETRREKACVELEKVRVLLEGLTQELDLRGLV